MDLLPMFLSLRQCTVLLVGAGKIAQDKAEILLRTGAFLRVVAPEATPQMQAWSRDGSVKWHARVFRNEDLEGCTLAIAATGCKEVNAQVCRAAKAMGILANSVDDPENCAFFFGATLRRGPLQIAISTSGESPAFGQLLRDQLHEQLAGDLGENILALGEQRRDILRTQPSGPARTALLKRLARRSWRDARFGFGAENASLQNEVLREEASGTVYLVGAGPGDPDLLTVKALRILQSAEVILHDDLVSAEILALAARDAVLIPVGKRCGTKSITQEEIHALMIHHAHTHRVVVRLKSGDPMLFGRAAEEMGALRRARIRYQIVPGITTAFAAAAAAGCSLTSRTSASSVLLTTGHLASGHRASDASTTRVVYMPGKDGAELSQKLQDEGLSAQRPCVVISHVSRANQKITHTTVEGLAHLAGVEAPSLLLVGEALAVREGASDASSHEPETSRLPVGAAGLINA